MLLIPALIVAQSEKHPEFNACKNQGIKNIELCFYKQTKELFFKEFNSPVILEREQYKGSVNEIRHVKRAEQISGGNELKVQRALK